MAFVAAELFSLKINLLKFSPAHVLMALFILNAFEFESLFNEEISVVDTPGFDFFILVCVSHSFYVSHNVYSRFGLMFLNEAQGMCRTP